MKNPTGHPARFSDAIIDYLKTLIDPDELVHDPFAGTGEQLGRLADEVGFTFRGTEIEPLYIVDKRVKVGNSRHKRTYPTRPWVGVTSPVYANGNADYFASSPNEAKPWKRNTYRHAVARLSHGSQAELAPDNMARFGYRGTKRGGSSLARESYWGLANVCARHWVVAERFILNVSDFMCGEVVEPHTQDWIDLMTSFEWRVGERERIATPRYRHGSDESRDQRVEFEDVIVFVH